MKDFFKKNWEYFALGLILILAIFFRVWHFSDWLHFGMDQARDANLVSDAVRNGPAQLPLLGPRAGGTFVRLGPVFYYFQYISAKIFHSVAPPVFAYPDLLFSVLTIPLFFFFLRVFFSKSVSLLVTALFAFNFVIIQFSRFAWNPNSVPFWTLLSFFSLLKLTADDISKKKRYLWLLLGTIAWAVAGQLHFIVLAAVPCVVFLFLLWSGKWRMFSWREAVFVVLALLLFFLPVVLSDIKMKGDNIKQFIWAFQYKPQEHSFFENIKASITSRANYYTLILATYTSPTGKASLLAGIFFSLFGIGYLAKNLREERVEKRKNFLKMIFVWLVVSFLALFPFAFQIKPRFLFFEIFIPFIFVGFGIKWISGGPKYRRLTFSAATVLVLAVIALNFEATSAWFHRLETGESFKVWGNRLVFVQYPKAITLSDSEKAAGYFKKKWEDNSSKMYFYGNLELRNPPLYILENLNEKIDYGYFSFKTRDFSAQYFSITTKNGDFSSLPKKHQAKFDLLEDKKFGKLGVQALRLKDIQPTDEDEAELEEPKVKSETEKNIKKGIKKSDRVLWEDMFN